MTNLSPGVFVGHVRHAARPVAWSFRLSPRAAQRRARRRFVPDGQIGSRRRRSPRIPCHQRGPRGRTKRNILSLFCHACLCVLGGERDTIHAILQEDLMKSPVQNRCPDLALDGGFAPSRSPVRPGRSNPARLARPSPEAARKIAQPAIAEARSESGRTMAVRVAGLSTRLATSCISSGWITRQQREYGHQRAIGRASNGRREGCGHGRVAAKACGPRRLADGAMVASGIPPAWTARSSALVGHCSAARRRRTDKNGAAAADLTTTFGVVGRCRWRQLSRRLLSPTIDDDIRAPPRRSQPIRVDPALYSVKSPQFSVEFRQSSARTRVSRACLRDARPSRRRRWRR